MPPSTHTPKPPIEAPDHAVNAETLQKWLWQCVAAGWDPLCAKAVALLGKQRVLYPNTKFAFVDEGSKK